MTDQRKTFSDLSPDEIDDRCEKAMADGFPYCIWIGEPFYVAHTHRKEASAVRAMKESAAETLKELAGE